MQQHQGPTSPAGQGRSVREFEEQMTALRKENFNLKLRLFFLEESIPVYQQSCNASSDGQEALFKQLIDCKVEAEILRQEVEEKQELLKDAALALTTMDQLTKETEGKNQTLIEQLNLKIHYLEVGCFWQSFL